MNFAGPLFGSPDPDSRFAYARVRHLERALKDDRILDALLDQLEVPGKSLAALKKLDTKEKLQLIEKQIDHFRGTSTSAWYGVPAAEVFAASIFRSGLSEKAVNEIFFGVSRESALLQPVANWLKSYGYDTYAEVPLGTKRVDALGYKKGGFFSGDNFVGIELKNDLVQFERALDQMTTFAQYTHEMWAACPPYMAAAYLDKHSGARSVKHWDANVLKSKLESFGFGLLLIEGQDVFEVIKPSQREPTAAKVKELMDSMESKLKVKSAGV
jgi:hypothetical protein